MNAPVSPHAFSLPSQISSYRLRPLAASLAMVWAATAAWNAHAQAQASALSAWDFALPAPQLKPSGQLTEAMDSSLRDQLPSYIKAEQISGQADIDIALEGGAELRRGDTVIRADRVEYLVPEDTVDAQGNVHINRAGNVYQGTALKLQIDAFQGDFTDATYQFLETQGHGDAERLEFIDRDNTVVHRATYTTCLRDDSASWQPDWMIRAKRITLDRQEDVGVAYGGTLEFKGVPILPVPAISFPLSDKRKSGLLPPTIGIDSISGVEYSQPYYWNIAPNRDATITPTLMSKRGVSLGTEFRYLEPTYSGVLDMLYMPDDRLRDRDRWGYNWKHSTSLDSPIGGLGLNWNLKRVSDDNYWRDFSACPATAAALTIVTSGCSAAMVGCRGLAGATAFRCTPKSGRCCKIWMRRLLRHSTACPSCNGAMTPPTGLPMGGTSTWSLTPRALRPILGIAATIQITASAAMRSHKSAGPLSFPVVSSLPKRRCT